MVGEVLADHGPLAPHDLEYFFRVDSEVVLVGGQALAFWADQYGVLSSAAAAGLTSDIDFLGSKRHAEVHALQLGDRFPGRVSCRLATLDDPPPSSAVILVSDYLGVEEPLVIDYVTAMAGYTLASETHMLHRAVPIEAYGASFRVMHPFDCLKSRVHNLIVIPAKRSQLGVEQCRTAVAVMCAHLAAVCARGPEAERQGALRLAEAVIELATHTNSMDVRHHFGINVMDAIPSAAFASRFRLVRWPQASQYVDERFARRCRRMPDTCRAEPRPSSVVVSGP